MNDYYKTWQPKLAENEKILWKGGPKKINIIDPSRKAFTYGLISVAVIWILLSVPRLLGLKENILISAIFLDLIPVLMIVSPIRDGLVLQKNIGYAITNYRVIAESFGEEYSINYNSHTKIERRSNDTICIGAAVNLKPGAERKALFTHGIFDEDKNRIGLVLYTAQSADKAMEALKSLKA